MISDKKWTILFDNLNVEQQRAFAKWLKQKHADTRSERLFLALLKWRKGRNLNIKVRYKQEVKNAEKIWKEYSKEKKITTTEAQLSESKPFDKDRFDKDMSALGRMLDDFLLLQQEMVEGKLRSIQLLEIYAKMDEVELMRRLLVDIEKDNAFHNHEIQFNYWYYKAHYDRKNNLSVENDKGKLLLHFHLHLLSQQLYMYVEMGDVRRLLKSENSPFEQLISPFLAMFPNYDYKEDKLLVFYEKFYQIYEEGCTIVDLKNALQLLKDNADYFLFNQLNSIWTALFNRINAEKKIELLWEAVQFALDKKIYYEGKTVLARNYLNAIRTFLRYFDMRPQPQKYWRMIRAMEANLPEKDKQTDDRYIIATFLVAWNEKEYEKFKELASQPPHLQEEKWIFEKKMLEIKSLYALEMKKPASRRFGIEIYFKNKDLWDVLNEKHKALEEEMKRDAENKLPRKQSFQNELKVFKFLLKIARDIYVMPTSNKGLISQIENEIESLQMLEIEYDKHWYIEMLHQLKEENKEE